ncbi:MAG TPA: lytic transglycosylase domain-containing protein [Bacteroidales bacterium]|nr:lytic transglycosylase domain-containing protein [Bacteroidales bacterium]
MAFLRLILIFVVSFNLLPANPLTDKLLKFSDKNTGHVAYPDLYYEINIAELNTSTSLYLYYDTRVQYYIDLYLNQRKEQLKEIVHLSDRYFPLFEKHLDTNKIPVEIKYLPVLESALSPTACSPSAAVGLWQFKEKTGRYYGLLINNIRDDRTDPELSTMAACRYLKDLYREFHDWNLALLAYNAGPVAVRKALKKNGNSADLQSIISDLPEPARNYLPALIAIIYLFHDYNTHF